MKRDKLSKIISESIKKVINEGTSDERVLNILYDVFSNMSGEEVCDIISSYLDCDTLENIANWLVRDEYYYEPDEESDDDEYEDDF